MPFDLSLVALARILIAFAIGVLIGAAPAVVLLLRAKRRIARLRRQVARLTTSMALLATPGRNGAPLEPVSSDSGEQSPSKVAGSAAEPSVAATSEVPTPRHDADAGKVVTEHESAGEPEPAPAATSEPAAEPAPSAQRVATPATDATSPVPPEQNGKPASAARPPAQHPVAPPVPPADTDPHLDKTLGLRPVEQGARDPGPQPVTAEPTGTEDDPMESSLRRIAQLRAQLSEATVEQARDSRRD